MDDFEHVHQQRKLNPAWKGIRIWTKVNWIPTLTDKDEPALVPQEHWPNFRGSNIFVVMIFVIMVNSNGAMG